MNTVHQDGRPLLTLAWKTERHLANGSGELRAADKSKTQSKPAPPSNIQRQDTDYDVKPAIKKPKPAPTRQESPARPRQAKIGQQFHAAAPDTGMSVHATQMGESEDQCDYDAVQQKIRMLRAFCN